MDDTRHNIDFNMNYYGHMNDPSSGSGTSSEMDHGVVVVMNDDNNIHTYNNTSMNPQASGSSNAYPNIVYEHIDNNSLMTNMFTTNNHAVTTHQHYSHMCDYRGPDHTGICTTDLHAIEPTQNINNQHSSQSGAQQR